MTQNLKKRRDRIVKDRYTSGAKGYNFDNGEVAFGKIRRINGKEVRESN